MNPIIEQAMALPLEEKRELYYALQEELEEENLYSDELLQEL